MQVLDYDHEIYADDDQLYITFKPKSGQSKADARAKHEGCIAEFHQ